MGKKEKPSKKAGSPAKPAKTAHELAAQAGANPEVAAALASQGYTPLAPGREYELDRSQLQYHLFIAYILLYCWLNLSAIKSEVKDKLMYTETDPAILNLSLVAILCLFATIKNYASESIFGIFNACIFTVLVYFGCIRPINTRDLYRDNPMYDPTAWVYGVMINCLGSLITFWGVYRSFNADKGKFLKTGGITASVLIALAAMLLYSPAEGTTCQDEPFFEVPKTIPNLQMQRVSKYLKMDDGIRIAVDVWLPWGWAPSAEEDKQNRTMMPAVLHMTRFNRNFEINKPFDRFRLRQLPPSSRHDLWTGELARELVDGGIGFVSFDVRGTGASFGERLTDLHPREIKDYKLILDWIKSREWCNGKVGAFGSSYGGNGALQLAARGGLAAVAVLDAELDIYAGLAFPGGVPSKAYSHEYASLASGLETGRSLGEIAHDLKLDLGPLEYFLLNNAFGTSAPVDGWTHDLKEAFQDHVSNVVNLSKGKKGLKDEVLVRGNTGKTLTFANISTLSNPVISALKKTKTPVSITAGFYDRVSASQALQLHQALGEQASITLGPWIYGGNACVLPNGKGSRSKFPITKYLKLFFECHLLQFCANLKKNELINYYVGGDERWQGTSAWPENLVQLKYYPNTDGSLQLDFPSVGTQSLDTCRSGIASGTQSRWNAVHYMYGLLPEFNKVAETKNNGYLEYITPRMEEDVLILGSPSVALEMKFKTALDVALFVYLDVLQHNRESFRYLTQGQRRTRHKSTSKGCSYMQKDFSEKSEIVKVELPLEPIAYALHKGDKIRLRISGPDLDNFDASGLDCGAGNLILENTRLALPTLPQE
eukprot:m.19352 g.19352  ORF g.19352 m.19352 type:complete len:827 (+) comp6547_c0_seq2:133-2613(+)